MGNELYDSTCPSLWLGATGPDAGHLRPRGPGWWPAGAYAVKFAELG